MFSKTPQSITVSMNNAERDAEVKKLEQWLVDHPGDRSAARRLITILDYYIPSEQGIGAFTDCQRAIAAQYQKYSWTTDLLNHEKVAQYYKEWQTCLSSMNVRPQIPITQLFMGKFHYVHGEQALCNVRLSLFKKEGVISRICHDCYKVQILPQNLMALIQTYSIMRELKLPRDNPRKCMIELREDIQYPYKGYIFCESEEEVIFCLKEFRQALQKLGVSGVLCGISHGCSEYSLKYPGFKYSNDGAHRSFDRPDSWDQSESKFYSEMQILLPDRVDNNKIYISIRDIITFYTWVKYAWIIGDDTCKMHLDKQTINLPKPFVTRVKNQAELRKKQMEELRDRLSFKG